MYCNQGISGPNPATDYYLLVNGNFNLIKNCYVERIGDLGHYGHGITIKWDSQNNAVRSCTAVNMTEDFCARHRGAKNNIFQKCNAIGGRAFVIRDGASYNTFKNCTATNVKSGYRFMDTEEDDGAQYAGRHNLFDACSVTNSDIGIQFDDYDRDSPADSNTWSECIFDNAAYMFYCGRTNEENMMIGGSVKNCKSYSSGKYPLDFKYTYVDFANNGFADPVVDTIYVDPDPVDTTTTTPPIQDGYIVISSTDVDDFNNKCYQLLKDGWKPYGNVVMLSDPFRCFQQWMK